MIEDKAQGVINMTCQAYKLPVAEVMAHNKNRYISRCRRSVVLALHLAGYSYNHIGVIMGRDPATISAALRKAKAEQGAKW